jgi:PAS domain S-box-containing protein
VLSTIAYPITLIASADAVFLGALGYLMWRRSGRAAGKAQALSDKETDPQASREALQNYQLILDTLDRSNVLLWWARVKKNGTRFDWNIRTPPQLRDNPIYRLAALVDKGWLWNDEQAPDHVKTDETSQAALLAGRSGYQQEFRIIGTDGVHWLAEEVLIRPAGDDEWNLAGVVTDVTKRHEAEEARRRTEVHLEQILKGADCILWQAVLTGDPESDLSWSMFIPPSVLYQRIFGEDAKPGNILWTEDMVPEWDKIRSTSRRALRAGQTEYEQEFHVTNRGKTFFLREHVKVTRLTGQSWSLVGVIFDISATREAEHELAAEKERLAVTLGSMTEGVITIGAHGRVLFINRAAADLCQWDAFEAVDRDIADICVLQDSAGRSAPINLGPVLELGSHVELPRHTQLVGRSGRLRLVEGRLIPVSNVSSKRIGAVLVLRDITERQRLEEQLQRAAKMESIGILAGGIAHDFNNILTAILSNLTLLELDLKGQSASGPILEDAIRATKRAGELTLQLLTFSKGGDPVRSAVHLPEVVKEAATFSHRGSNVKSEFDLPADLWPADVDKAQIGQVIQNLVINATQAMPNGGTLKLSASNRSIPPGTHSVLAGGDYVCISVSDTGVGISPENIEKIFDPYFTTKLQGSGLGLATVFSIIRRHQGHIEVSSGPGLGSVFTFWLPAAREARPQPNPHPSYEGAERRARVLFMDDEEQNIRVAEKLMRRMGLDFEAVPDGTRAVERYKEAKQEGVPFDLVVMDLTIPGGMGGREAISILRSFDPDVRAIVSSGYSSDLAMADFRKHGFRGMVAKPYDISELASVIRGVLAEKDAEA